MLSPPFSLATPLPSLLPLPSPPLLSQVLRIPGVVAATSVVELSEIQMGLVRLGMTLLVLIMIGAGGIYTTEVWLFEQFNGMNITKYNESVDPSFDFWTFGDCLYFIFVTFSTVGYGDLTPNNWGSKMVIIALICATVAIVPAQLDALGDIIAATSRFRRRMTVEGTFHGIRHAVLLGPRRLSTVRNFVTEFYHPNHSSKRAQNAMPLVVMGDWEPDEGMKTLLAGPLVREHLYYFKGNSMDEDDLNMIDIRNAEKVFILPDPDAGDQADMVTIMTTLILRHIHPTLTANTFVQVSGRHAVGHLKEADVSSTQSVSLDILLASLMASACLRPGLPAFIDNLMQSFSDEANEENCHLPKWLSDEYLPGAGIEMYEIPIPDLLDGITFAEAASVIYQIFKGEIVLIGVVDADENQALNKDAKEYKRKTPMERHVDDLLGVTNLSEAERSKLDAVIMKTRGKHRATHDESLANSFVHGFGSGVPDHTALCELLKNRRSKDRTHCAFNPSSSGQTPFTLTKGTRAIVICDSLLEGMQMANPKNYIGSNFVPLNERKGEKPPLNAHISVPSMARVQPIEEAPEGAEGNEKKEESGENGEDGEGGEQKQGGKGYGGVRGVRRLQTTFTAEATNDHWHSAASTGLASGARRQVIICGEPADMITLISVFTQQNIKVVGLFPQENMMAHAVGAK